MDQCSLGTILTVGLGNDEITVIIASADAAGATHLVDIRAWPHSERHEDHDTKAVANACKVLGLEYDWKLDLSPPPGLRRRYAGRGKSKGVWDEYASGFRQHLRSVEGKRGIASLKHLINTGATVCLLCAERRHSRCHRSLVTERLGQELQFKVVHLVLGEDSVVIPPHPLTEQSALF